MMPPSHRPRGRAAPNVEYERDRRGSRARGYDHRWDEARAAHLREHPLCRYCELEGRVTPAMLVDHFYPHRGDRAVFWERRWWVSSCAPCHSGPKQAAERAGRTALDALARRLGISK
jgi:5-methylcytosine-specific restriction endonuclease McrA